MLNWPRWSAGLNSSSILLRLPGVLPGLTGGTTRPLFSRTMPRSLRSLTARMSLSTALGWPSKLRLMPTISEMLVHFTCRVREIGCCAGWPILAISWALRLSKSMVTTPGSSRQLCGTFTSPLIQTLAIGVLGCGSSW
ncbi:hypothetical protein D9M68_895330 [compost metagenome]